MCAFPLALNLYSDVKVRLKDSAKSDVNVSCAVAATLFVSGVSGAISIFIIFFCRFYESGVAYTREAES
jgi:hypothetical protein